MLFKWTALLGSSEQVWMHHIKVLTPKFNTFWTWVSNLKNSSVRKYFWTCFKPKKNISYKNTHFRIKVLNMKRVLVKTLTMGTKLKKEYFLKTFLILKYITNAFIAYCETILGCQNF